MRSRFLFPQIAKILWIRMLDLSNHWMGGVMDFQAQKKVVLDHHAALDRARPGEAREALERHCDPAMVWMGMHPWDEIVGLDRLAEEVWEPLHHAFGPLQRRPDIFFAGAASAHGRPGDWVCEMGHLLGLFDQPFLGIQPTRKMAFLRYAEFSRVQDGRIVEQALYFDLGFLMVQADVSPWASTTGAMVLTPGPRMHDGLLLEACPPKDGAATLALIERMIARLVSKGVRTTMEDLGHDWRADMLWWGPSGIGASYTHGRYIEQHCAPFEAGLEFVRHDGHETRIAEGNFGGFFGYPSLVMKPTGGYMSNTTAGDISFEMRIVDIYRREGDLLAENWIFIDHLHVLSQLGNDPLRRLQGG